MSTQRTITARERSAGVVAHLALPLRVDAASGLAAHVQDSDEDLTQSLAILMSTRPGERADAPGYGTPDALFANPDPEAIADAAAEWEERADPVRVRSAVRGLIEDQPSAGSTTTVTDVQRTASGGAG